MKKFFSVLLLLVIVHISYQQDPMKVLMEELIQILRTNPKMAPQLLKTHSTQIIAYLRTMEKKEPNLKDIVDITYAST